MKKYEFEVAENEVGMRLDKFLTAKLPEITRSKIQTIIEEDLVCDAKIKVLASSHKTKIGEKIFVIIPAAKPSHLEAHDIPYEIVFEDDDLMVINKPAGLTVHPGAGNHNNTLVNALLFTHRNKLSGVGGEFRPGIVHRLDKDTSGLMIVAKNDFIHNLLGEKLRKREIKRSYLTFIYGVLSPAKGKIDKNVVRSRTNRLKMVVAKTIGRSAITNYETKEIYLDGFISLVECRLETGRTHQIRVHMESLKHSIVGDQTYSSCKKTAPNDIESGAKNVIEKFPRQALHSYKISFTHPRSEEEMSFEIPLPDDLKKLEKCLKKS